MPRALQGKPPTERRRIMASTAEDKQHPEDEKAPKSDEKAPEARPSFYRRHKWFVRIVTVLAVLVVGSAIAIAVAVRHR